MFSSLGLMFVKLMFFAIEIRSCTGTHAHTEKGERGKREEREKSILDSIDVSV